VWFPVFRSRNQELPEHRVAQVFISRSPIVHLLLETLPSQPFDALAKSIGGLDVLDCGNLPITLLERPETGGALKRDSTFETVLQES